MNIVVINTIQTFWSCIGIKRRKQAVILIILMLIGSFIEFLSISAIFPFLGVISSPEKVFQNPMFKSINNFLMFDNSQQIILPITLVFIFAITVSNFFKAFTTVLQTRFSFSVGMELSSSIYRNMLYQPYEVHLSKNSSEVVAAISNKVGAVISNSLIPMLNIIASSTILIVIFLGVLFVEPIATLFGFITLIFIYNLIIIITKKKLMIAGEIINRESSRTVKILQEGLYGIRDVLIAGTQEIYCKAFSNADSNLRRSQATVHIISTIPRYIVETVGLCLMAIFAFTLTQNSSNENVIPIVGLIAFGAQRILPLLQQIYLGLSLIKGGYSTLIDVMELRGHGNNTTLVNSCRIVPIKFNHSISIKNLSFHYSKVSSFAIKNINLEIIKGSRIGVVGETGSGKSTFIDIVMGLLQPTLGSVSIDGVDLKKANVRSWQSRIGHVPQSIFLWDASIAENIALGVPKADIDYELVMRAAEKARISKVIEKLPDGYSTNVGERGIKLSGGQRQRIGIARALYKEVDVLVFDEATSALDTKTEKSIVLELSKLSKDITIFIVAHRYSTLAGCNLIIELKNGELIRDGSYEDLLPDGSL
jgi:ABC-type multidrug transport system fused ATPase/permease subunit